MTTRFPLLAATLLAAPLATPSAARAQPVTGAYVNLGGGGTLLQEQQSRPSPGLGLSPKKFTWDAGAVGLGSVGYGFGNGLRLEVEGHYRTNTLQRFGRTLLPGVSGGEQQEYGAMVNALYDLDIGSPYVFPYLGVGAGYARTELHKVYAATPLAKFDATDSYNSMGYQGIVGASFPTPWVPGLSVTAEYRFFGVVDGGSYQGDYTAPRPLSPGLHHGEVKLFNDYNHSVLLGVRYAFNTAPAPVTAAPAPVPAAVAADASARTYLVFFDWDRADLTDRARQIVARAAQAGTQATTTHIEVNGYTDKSGTASYNQRLSMRRAQAVTLELLRDGVPRGEIAVQGYGESNPLVPTAQGVREPQNRRVEIILR